MKTKHRTLVIKAKRRAKIRDFYNTLDDLYRQEQNEEREEPQRIYREFENTDRYYIQNSIRLNY